MIPYGKHDVTEDDIASVIQILKSEFLTQGPTVPKFETAVASYCKVKHAVAVNSATSALHIALLALGVGKEDHVWTVPITFVATANAARYCDAIVDFVDIDPKTYNISIDALKEKLKKTLADEPEKLPKVVIPVHLTGQTCDMEAIHSLSKEYNFRLVEDASHAIGGKYKGEPVGCCKYSDVTVFSFHPVKIITTAEGGMALTNSEHLKTLMELYRSHGVTRNPEMLTRETNNGSWYYEQLVLGFNYRMNDIQAALGLSQLKRLDTYVDARRRIAANYDKKLAGLPITLPEQAHFSYSAYHLYVIRLDNSKTTLRSHRKIFEVLRSKGILVNLHYIPVHLQPYYASLGFKKGDFPNSEIYYEEAISIPIFPTMTSQEQEFVISAIKSCV